MKNEVQYRKTKDVYKEQKEVNKNCNIFATCPTCMYNIETINPETGMEEYFCGHAKKGE